MTALPDFVTFVLVAILLVGLYLAGCVVVVEILDWIDRRHLAIHDEATCHDAAVLRRASTPSDNNTETENQP
jgi:hypothetical protein